MKDSKNNKILDLILNKNLSQKEVGSRVGLSQQAVSKRFKKIVKELNLKKWGGVPIAHNQKSSKKTEKTTKEWSYHALQFEIISYYRTKKYNEILIKHQGKTVSIGDWLVMCYKHKIIIWLREGLEFTSKTSQECIIKANNSLIALILHLENNFGFYVLKDRKSNISLLKHHLSYRNAPEHDIITKEYMYIQFKQHGKVIMQYDRSKGFKEREYPSEATYHADLIEPYLMDFLNQPLTNSQLTSRMNDLVDLIEKLIRSKL